MREAKYGAYARLPPRNMTLGSVTFGRRELLARDTLNKERTGILTDGAQQTGSPRWYW